MAQSYKITLYSIFVVFAFCAVFAEQTQTLSETIFAQTFLKRYHYLSPLKSGNHDWKTALQLYQAFMHLPVTGKLDDATFKEMKKPRCGFPDMEEDREGTGISKRYGISAQPWTSPFLTYGFVNYCEDMTKSLCESTIAKAFKLWSDSSVLNFTKVSDVSKASIKIAFVRRSHGNCPFSFDGTSGVLAHAQYPTGGSIHFDEDEVFTAQSYPPIGTIDLYSVAVHEIGHAIGIAHTDIKTAIMHSEYKYIGVNIPLHADDINAVAYLYGGGTVQPQVTQTLNCSDSSAVCAKYKYLCTAIDNKAQMKKLCPSTCGYCTVLNSKICVNKINDDWCAAYKAKGVCKDPVVLEGCQKDCNAACYT